MRKVFEQSPKQAVIVYRKKDDEYAHLMANLISAHTEYEVAEWEEKDWLANKAVTSSSQKVIFLGDSKEAHKRHMGMTWAYNQLKMKYGWLGNQCVVDIDIIAADDIKEFCEYYQQKTMEHEVICEKPILGLPGDILTDITTKSEDTVEVLSESDIAPIVSNEDKRPERKRPAFPITLPKIQKSDLAKLSTDAISPINKQVTRVKLIRFQYNLIIRIFVFNGGLRDFMES
jgi:hypothetical protein